MLTFYLSNFLLDYFSALYKLQADNLVSLEPRFLKLTICAYVRFSHAAIILQFMLFV